MADPRNEIEEPGPRSVPGTKGTSHMTMIPSKGREIHVEGVLAWKNRDAVGWWEIEALCLEVIRLRAALRGQSE